VKLMRRDVWAVAVVSLAAAKRRVRELALD
jgi:hypothetical protein